MGLLDALKDQGIQVALNHLLGDIGSLSKLTIDRPKQRLAGTLTLTGEERPILVEVKGWTLADATHPHAIRIAHASADRAWLTAALERLVVKRWIAVPPDMMGKITLALG